MLFILIKFPFFLLMCGELKKKTHTSRSLKLSMKAYKLYKTVAVYNNIRKTQTLPFK